MPHAHKAFGECGLAHHAPPRPAPPSLPAHVSTDPFQRRTVLALESINKILTKEANERSEDNRKQNLVDEWKFVSRVLDRTLFMTFTTAAIIFNLSILTSSPFRERFSYCPIDNCEEMTMEEIIALTANSASKHKFGDVPSADADKAEGSAAHLKSGPNDLVALPDEQSLALESFKTPQSHQRPPPLQRGHWEPAEPWDENVYTATPRPEYRAYESQRQHPTPPEAHPSSQGTATRDGGRRG